MSVQPEEHPAPPTSATAAQLRADRRAGAWVPRSSRTGHGCWRMPGTVRASPRCTGSWTRGGSGSPRPRLWTRSWREVATTPTAWTWTRSSVRVRE